MTSALMRWSDALSQPGRVLLVVNSAPNQQGEIGRAVDALAAHGGLDRVSAIAPTVVADDLIRRGISGAALLRFEVEVGYFLESDRALQWAARRDAAFVVGTEPYAPNNEEVKDAFERRVAPMVGRGRFLAHTLPGEQVVVLTLADLWRRAARADAVDAHRQRIGDAVAHLHERWSAGTTPDREAAEALAAQWLEPPPAGSPPVATIQSALQTSERLFRAMHVDGGYPAPPVRVVCDPPGFSPRAGWLGDALTTVRRPAQLAAGGRHRHHRLWFRGVAEGPYTYLLMSRPVTLRAGDAAVAEGRLYRGGVTLGLVKDDVWASRIDLVDPGGFILAAVARQDGAHALVIANCLHGADRRLSVAIRRFGLRRAH